MSVPRSRAGRSRTWWTVAIGGAAVAAIGVAVAVAALSGKGEPRTASHAAPKPAASRTLVVSKTDEGISPTNQSLRATLVSGSLPARSVTATVLTDDNCNPDAAGISHCLNSLRMPDGSVAQVRHHHAMSNVACLTPGERLTVERATQ